MGRPKGSKNKPKFGKMVAKKTGRRGRPVGSKNHKRTLADYGPSSLKVLACSKCETPTNAGSEAVSVLCPSCTQSSLPKADWGYHKKTNVDPNAPKRGRGRPKGSGKMVKVVADPNTPKRPRGRPRTRPILPPKPTAGYGRGWHLKAKFTAPDGKKFAFGKLVKG